MQSEKSFNTPMHPNTSQFKGTRTIQHLNNPVQDYVIPATTDAETLTFLEI